MRFSRRKAFLGFDVEGKEWASTICMCLSGVSDTHDDVQALGAGIEVSKPELGS